MPSPEPVTARFPVANCAQCGKSVITCVAFDDAGNECRVCAHCDAPISAQIDWVSATELESTGYYIGSPNASRSGGCGCSSGGCSMRKH